MNQNRNKSIYFDPRVQNDSEWENHTNLSVMFD